MNKTSFLAGIILGFMLAMCADSFVDIGMMESAYATEDFTDSGVGCVDDCLDPQ